MYFCLRKVGELYGMSAVNMYFNLPDPCKSGLILHTIVNTVLMFYLCFIHRTTQATVGRKYLISGSYIRQNVQTLYLWSDKLLNPNRLSKKAVKT